MRLRIALDTNVLAYSEGIERASDDAAKVDLSRRLMTGPAGADGRPVLAVQVLAELQHVLVRKSGVPRAEASARVRRVAAAGDIIAATGAVLKAALDLSTDHGLQIFDALILASAAEARCDLLLSEDLQDGFGWRGVVVSNPFGAAPDARLTRRLKAP